MIKTAKQTITADIAIIGGGSRRLPRATLKNSARRVSRPCFPAMPSGRKTLASPTATACQDPAATDRCHS